MFAPVAARRQKKLKEESVPLFVLFVLFGQAKRTLKEKYHKETFLLSYFCVTKSTKSHLRGLSSLLKIFFRVHELVARSSAWQVCAANDKAKIGGFALSTASSIPRVRTYHTREPSRFVRALSARPLDNGWRGRGSNMRADGIKR